MADVFISYRKADRAKAEALAKAFRVENIDVWWDDGLEAGQTFDEKIQSVLEQAKAVVVVWSRESVKSEWVRAESSVGRERGVLVPVMIQPVNIPVPFNLIHTADLIGWNGDRAHKGYQDVVKQVKTLAGKQNVKPLKPPPNPALRALWRAVAAVAVIAVIGASTWVLQPWTWEMFKPEDPAVVAAREAKAKRDAQLAELAPLGVSAQDFEQLDWFPIMSTKYKKETYPQIVEIADKGNLPAQALLCAAHFWGVYSNVGSQDLARQRCTDAAEAGEPIAQFYLGHVLAQGGDEEGATSWYKKAADQGYGQALLRLAYRTGRGQGTSYNPKHAAELAHAAMDKGLPEAEFAYGYYLLNGAEGEEKKAEGLPLMESGAAKGSTVAMFSLAEMYRKGEDGVSRDPVKARKLYEAVLASPDDQLHSNAKGGLKDLDEEAAAAVQPAKN